MAVICGTPAPVTMRVVQIDPGPMPIFTASAPRSMAARVPSAVATLPTISATSGKRCRRTAAASSTPLLWACEESSTSRSTLASTSAAARSRYSPEAPTAAPTRRRPSSSLQARGYSIIFWMSLTVIRPFRPPARSTTRSFSILCLCRSALASSRVVPSGTVTRFSRVIRSEMRRFRLLSKRRSRLVRMPTSRPSASVTGTPEILKCAMSSSASRDPLLGAHGHRVDDHPGFAALHLVDLRRLEVDRQVLVDDAEAALLRERDRQPRLGHGVHGGGEDRDVEVDLPAEAGAQIDLVRMHRRVAGLDQHVVEGQGEARGVAGFGHRLGGGGCECNRLARRG